MRQACSVGGGFRPPQQKEINDRCINQKCFQKLFVEFYHSELLIFIWYYKSLVRESEIDIDNQCVDSVSSLMIKLAVDIALLGMWRFPAM